MLNTVIGWMCRTFHEQPYQAQMDFTIVAGLLLVLLVLGRPVIFPIVAAHVRTLGANDEEEGSVLIRLTPNTTTACGLTYLRLTMQCS